MIRNKYEFEIGKYKDSTNKYYIDISEINKHDQIIIDLDTYEIIPKYIESECITVEYVYVGSLEFSANNKISDEESHDLISLVNIDSYLLYMQRLLNDYKVSFRKVGNRIYVDRIPMPEYFEISEDQEWTKHQAIADYFKYFLKQSK